MQQRLTADKLSMEGCLNLLCNFVESVCSDYANAYAMSLRYPGSQKCMCHRDRLRAYIKSDYFCNLTTLDGEQVISMIETNYKNGNKRLNGGFRYEPYSQGRG